MNTYSRGQRGRLSEGAASQMLEVRLQAESAQALDCFAVVLDAEGRALGSPYLLDRPGAATPEGAVAAVALDARATACFRLRLDRLPGGAERVAFALTCEGTQTLAALTRGSLSVWAGTEELLRFSFAGADMEPVRATVVGELYRREAWRFAAVAQGYEGGRAALLEAVGLPEAVGTPGGSAGRQLATGERIELFQLIRQPSFSLRLEGLEGALVCLGLNSEGRLSGAETVVHPLRPASPEGAVHLDRDGALHIDLRLLPRSVARLVVAIVREEATKPGAGRLALESAGAAPVSIPVEIAAPLGAFLVAELYWKDTWRLGVLGQGYTGGMPAMLAAYGLAPGQGEALTLTVGGKVPMASLAETPFFELELALAGSPAIAVQVMAVGVVGEKAVHGWPLMAASRKFPGFEARTEGAGRWRFALNFAKLQDSVERLIFAIEAQQARAEAPLRGTLRVLADGREVARHKIKQAAWQGRRTTTLAEVYHRDGWRLGLIDQSAPEGLEALLVRLNRPDLAAAWQRQQQLALPSETVVRGQKLALAERLGSSRLQVHLGFEAAGAVGLDFVCLGLDASGRLASPGYEVYGGRNASPDGAVTYYPGLSGEQASFEIDLDGLSERVERLAIGVLVAGTGRLTGGLLSVSSGEREVLSFPIGEADLGAGQAWVLCELYRTDSWRFAAVAQRYAEGPAALLHHFAVPPRALFEAPLAMSPTEQHQPGGPISTSGPLTIEMNWAAQSTAPRGLLGLLARAPSVSLGCLYILQDGQQGVLRQGEPAPSFFQFEAALSRRQSAGRTTLRIQRPDWLAYMLIFAVAPESGGFAAIATELIATEAGGRRSTLSFAPAAQPRGFLAIGLLEREAGELVLARKGVYLADLAEADRLLAVGGLRFTPDPA